MFTEDQEQFRDVVARFLTDKSPPSAVRELMQSPEGYDTAVWQQLSQEVGLVGTHLPESYGGFGFGPVELGIVCQEMGRHLFCGPYFATAVMSAYALLIGADESQKARLLPRIASGDLKAALVLDDIGDPAGIGRHIKADGKRLTGTAKLVVDAQVADTLIVAAGDDSGLGLFSVQPADVEIEPQVALDPTRKLASVTLAGVIAEPLGRLDGAGLQNLWDHLSTALAHEMIGGAERLFETTIEYMKMRVQFGRAIGSFQSLKHRCADLLLDLELAKAMTHQAARYLATGAGDDYSPNMAKALASDTYISTAKQAIQLRGGIGFTWEEDTHLWFKRAKASEVFLGTSNWHRERMMQRLEAKANAPGAQRVREAANG